MAFEPHPFAAALSWTQEHDFGPGVHPYCVVVDSLGQTRLTVPDYTVDGQVTIRFNVATAGVLSIWDPTLAGGGIEVPPPEASRASPPFENAVLVEIRGPGKSDRFGKPDGTGNPLWVGNAPGYIKRAKKHSKSGETDKLAKTDVFYIRDLQGVPVIEEPGASWEASTVTIDDLRKGSVVRRRFTVRETNHSATGLLDVDSLRLDLSTETEVA